MYYKLVYLDKSTIDIVTKYFMVTKIAKLFAWINKNGITLVKTIQLVNSIDDVEEVIYL